MFLKYLTLFGSLFLSLNVISQDQQKLDSLISAYEQQNDYKKKVVLAETIFKETIHKSPETAVKFAFESLNISSTNNFKQGKANALYNIGDYHVKKRNYDSISFYFREAAKAYRNIEDYEREFNTFFLWSKMEMKKGDFPSALNLIDQSYEVALQSKKGALISDALKQKGVIYMREAKYEKSVEEFIKALKICDTLKEKDLYRVGELKSGIAIIDLQRGYPEKALPNLKEALILYEEVKSYYWMSVLNMEIGGCYEEMSDNEQALLHYKKSLDAGYKMNQEDFQAASLGNIANIYLKQEKYDDALSNLKKAIEITERLGPVSNLAIGYANVGEVYLKKNRLKDALSYFNKSIALSDSIAANETLMKGYQIRSKVYKKLGDYSKALNDFELYSNTKDSIFNTTKSKQIEELKTAYETEKKEQEIVTQKKEIELLNTKNKVSNLQRILLALGLALALIAIYAFYQRNKRNKLAKENAEADLEFKTKELTTHALHLAKKNEVLNDLKQKAKVLKADANADPGYQMLIQTINFDLQDDNNWENFSKYFEQVHKGFNNKAQEQFPSITKNDLRLMALLKMNLSSKEIANILNISSDGIKKARQRLRKKMGLDSNESLEATIISI